MLFSSSLVLKEGREEEGGGEGRERKKEKKRKEQIEILIWDLLQIRFYEFGCQGRTSFAIEIMSMC